MMVTVNRDEGTVEFSLSLDLVAIIGGTALAVIIILCVALICVCRTRSIRDDPKPKKDGAKKNMQDEEAGPEGSQRKLKGNGASFEMQNV